MVATPDLLFSKKIFYKPLIAIEQMTENSVLRRSLRIQSVQNIHSRNVPSLVKHVYWIRKNHDLRQDMSGQQENYENTKFKSRISMNGKCKVQFMF